METEVFTSGPHRLLKNAQVSHFLRKWCSFAVDQSFQLTLDARMTFTKWYRQ